MSYQVVINQGGLHNYLENEMSLEYKLSTLDRQRS